MREGMREGEERRGMGKEGKRLRRIWAERY